MISRFASTSFGPQPGQHANCLACRATGCCQLPTGAGVPLTGASSSPRSELWALKRSYGTGQCAICGWPGMQWDCGSNVWRTTSGARAACKRWRVANVGAVRRSGGGIPPNRPAIPRRAARAVAAGRRLAPIAPPRRRIPQLRKGLLWAC